MEPMGNQYGTMPFWEALLVEAFEISAPRGPRLSALSFSKIALALDAPSAPGTRRAQYPLIKEYTLNYRGFNITI